MTAVELTIPGRRYTISGSGYSTEGTIKHVVGPAGRAARRSFCCRWRSPRTPSSKDGELIGDPTEGALVVLAEKGGLDCGRRRGRRYPRVAELPFDSDYKLMATFHRMTGRERP